MTYLPNIKFNNNLMRRIVEHLDSTNGNIHKIDLCFKDIKNIKMWISLENVNGVLHLTQGSNNFKALKLRHSIESILNYVNDHMWANALCMFDSGQFKIVEMKIK